MKTVFEYIGLRAGELIPILLLVVLFGMFAHTQLTAETVASSVLVAYFVIIFYRRVVGELVLFPLLQKACWLWDFVLSLLGRTSGGDYLELKKRGIRAFHLRDAYNEIRNKYLSSEDQTRLRTLHGEVHVFYITSIALFLVHASSVFPESLKSFAPGLTQVSVQNGQTALAFAWVALIVGVFVDAKQHEIGAIKFRDDDKLFERFVDERSSFYRTSPLELAILGTSTLLQVAAMIALVWWTGDQLN